VREHGAHLHVRLAAHHVGAGPLGGAAAVVPVGERGRHLLAPLTLLAEIVAVQGTVRVAVLVAFDDDGRDGDDVQGVDGSVRDADTIEAAHSGEWELLAVCSYPADVARVGPAADADTLHAAVVGLPVILILDKLKVLRTV